MNKTFVHLDTNSFSDVLTGIYGKSYEILLNSIGVEGGKCYNTILDNTTHRLRNITRLKLTLSVVYDARSFTMKHSTQNLNAWT